MTHFRGLTCKPVASSGLRAPSSRINGHLLRLRKLVTLGQSRGQYASSMRLRSGSALRLLGSDSRKPSRVFRYWRQTFLENESFGSDRRIPGNVTKTSHASTSLRWLCALEDSESNDR